MFGFQPSIPPLPSDLSFSGKTALVTGANVGIGLATCLHLLQHNLSTLLITVRSSAKGVATKTHLLSDPVVEALPRQPTIYVYEAEFSDPKSVQALAEKVGADLGDRRLDYAVLNAGLVLWEVERSKATGNELMFQVNFASTSLLGLLLLPFLTRSSTSSTDPARLTFVGSSAMAENSLKKRANTLAKSTTPLFTQLSESANKTMGNLRYGDSKLLVYMFVRELSKRVGGPNVDSEHGRGVIVNAMCPGMVATNLERDMPAWSTPVILLIKGWRSRTPEVGGRTVIHAVALVGSESQGEFLTHNQVTRYVVSFPPKCSSASALPLC